jgi:carbamoyltransferase
MTHPPICGLKMTHDGGVAVVEDNRLLFSIEAEKLNNNPRYSELQDLSAIDAILTENGMPLADIHSISIDGWNRPRRSVRAKSPDGSWVRPRVAGYLDDSWERSPFHSIDGVLPMPGGPRDYRSYAHVIDHVFAGYCSSPFARESQPALILVWDGNMAAHLFHFDPQHRRLKQQGVVLDILGGIYPGFASGFEPFRINDLGVSFRPGAAFRIQRAFLPISGKAMAYMGLGAPDEDVVTVFKQTAAKMPPRGFVDGLRWCRLAKKQTDKMGIPDPVVLASFQEFLFRELYDALRKALDSYSTPPPICLVGGCALNIKWNSALRATGLFSDVWVPPFPNDSGSAIGAACTEMVRVSDQVALEWSVFSGPDLVMSDDCPEGWQRRPCTIAEVAGLLAESDEPVTFLYGRAELGPRALGHRSIVAPARNVEMRERLNQIKHREWYRPVAPICLEDRATGVFSPGTTDPHMLFDHVVRAEWKARIPAVVHLDGTARLQTVGAENPVLAELLAEYERRTGIPVLCNTSANRPGCGFFPDTKSAMLWGGTKYVWANGVLFSKAGQPEA